MDLLQAVLLGALQGLTEWLPVSSSGHLALAQLALGLSPPVFFDVALHAGTLLALLAFFRKELLALLRALLSLDFKGKEGRLIPLALLALIPTALIGFGLKGFFESMFYSARLIGVALLLNGLLLYSTRSSNGKAGLSPASALVIGIAQGIAVAPGISRSGSTISAGLLQGVERRRAAWFSFLIAIPAIAGATAFEALNAVACPVGAMELLAGMTTAALVGYASIFLLFRALDSRRFHLFAWYCWIVGAAAIAAG